MKSGQYGHYHPDNASNPNAVPVHEAMGPHIQRQTHHNAVGANVGLATWSTAPYVPPEAKTKDTRLCPVGDCKAWGTVKHNGLCNAHGQQEAADGDPGPVA